MVTLWTMSKPSITVGIDIGTHEVRVVITKNDESGALPKIIGTGKAESKGLRYGYVINTPDVIRCVTSAVKQAEKMAEVKVERAFLAIGGVGLSGYNGSGSTMVSRGDGEVTESDCAAAISNAESGLDKSLTQNRKIIYSIPISWKIDGKHVQGRIVGNKAVRIDVKALFISTIESHMDDLCEAVEEAGIKVVDVVASPIAASFVTLNRSQKIQGCVLANIGAETCSIVVFENDIPISLEVFPIGGTNITNDVALSLRVSLEEAEAVKTGQASSSSVGKRDLERTISSRLSEIFALIDAHLKKNHTSGLLPAGIIITGGSSAIHAIEDFARNSLKLPSRLASNNPISNRVQLKDSSWSVAYGICVWGKSNDDDESINFGRISKSIFRKLTSGFRQFIP